MSIEIDVFPFEFDLSKSPLIAYSLNAPNPDEAGGVYAARVRKISKLPAIWLRGHNCLIVSAHFTMDKAISLLDTLHQMNLEALQNTTDIELIPDLEITSAHIAQYVAEGVLDLADDAINIAFNSQNKRIAKVQITRQAHFKGLAPDATTSALQIIVRSSMSSVDALSDYLSTYGENQAKEAQLEIKCRKTTGTFDGVVGTLDSQYDNNMTWRQFLKSLNPSDYPSSWLDTLPGDHAVVALKPNYGKKRYCYPIKALKIVVSTANLSRFTQTDNERKTISAELKMPPFKRHQMIQTVWQALQGYFTEQKLPIRLLPAYNQSNHPTRFAMMKDLDFNQSLRFAKGTVSIQKDSDILPALQKQGIFHISTPTIRVAVVDAVYGENHRTERHNQLLRMKTSFESLGITLQSVTNYLYANEIEQQKQRSQLRSMLRQAIQATPDVILIYLPEADRKQHSSDDASSLYNVTKAVTIGAGVASQVIYENTIANAYADANIIMGILGKTGNIPYVLAQPLDFVDVVVGLDIGRRKMGNGGSLNVGAMSRVYLNDGHLLGYNLAGGSIVDGETIPQTVLENIFPPEEFGGKRVIIHRDGRFPIPELESLMQWGDIIQAQFFPIEVTKSGTPRMYQILNGKIDQTNKQTVFYLDEQTAFIVTSPPPAFKGVAKTTAQPLKIRNLSRLTLEQALLSVSNLTLLHYGSVRPPRLPVSTHASDKIAGFYLRDIRPQQTKGNKPFWL